MKNLRVTEYDINGLELTSYNITVDLNDYEEPKMSEAAWDYFNNYGALKDTKEMVFADLDSKTDYDDCFEYEICEWIEVK